MRTSLLFSSIVLLWATTAVGQQAGDRVVVIADKAQLKIETAAVGSVPQGRIVSVKQVDGDWLWVIDSGVKPAKKGWLKRREVVSVDKAFEFFNTALRKKPTATLYAIRGRLWSEKAQYDKALVDLNE